jgi:hypothetical protein
VTCQSKTFLIVRPGLSSNKTLSFNLPLSSTHVPILLFGLFWRRKSPASVLARKPWPLAHGSSAYISPA